jgi:hypothetical protein
MNYVNTACDQLIVLMDNTLSYILPDKYQGDLEFAKILIKNMSKEDKVDVVMGNIINHLLPRKEDIEKRNDKFMEDATLLNIVMTKSKLKKEHISEFKKIWKSLEDDDKNELWQFAEVFVTLGEEYKKNT